MSARAEPEPRPGLAPDAQPATSQAPSAQQAIEDAVTEELVALYERQSSRTGPVIGLIALLIGAAAWERAPSWLVIGWVLFEWATLVIRHVGLRLSPRLNIGTRQRLRLAQGLRALHAVSNASAVIFFPFLSDLGRTLVTLILAGLTTGAIGTSGGYLPVYLVYAGPVMVALMLGWTFTPVQGEDAWLSKFMAPLVMAFTLIMVGLARDNFRAFKKAVAKRMEESLLNQKLLSALDQAHAADAAKTRFLASASHDLRQPLHSLSLFFATLRLQVAPQDSHNQRLLEHIDQALSALQSQMNTLLDMSKLDAGMVQLEWRHFALPGLLEQLKSAYEPVARQKNVRLRVDCPLPLDLYSDSEQFSRVLRNLVDNAIKYTSHGEVCLEARRHGEDKVRVRIRDSGCGIAPRHQGQVFEEFFQVDNPERDRNRGLGLGLPIVRRLAGLLRIELDLHSVPGVGTTVTLLIPRGNAHAQAPDAKPDLRDFQPSMPRCHVLVLDDEAAVRTGTEALLKRMGCDVSLAASTEEALRLAARQAPDLVLADLRLRAQESGITAVQMLRQQHPHLSAIIITGDTAPERLLQAQAAGLKVLHKPVAADALMRAIAASLDSSTA